MAPDLKQIAGLFNDCIEKIRNEKHDDLEEMAAKWLKDARYALMRKIEAEYYQLANSRGKPALQQSWALDPSTALVISTQTHPPILRPFRNAIEANLRKLMADCGFNARVQHVPGILMSGDFYSVQIRFPHWVTNHSHIPDMLQIEDEFSNPGTGGFLALLPANNDDSQAEGDASSSRIMTRSQSRRRGTGGVRSGRKRRRIGQ